MRSSCSQVCVNTRTGSAITWENLPSFFFILFSCMRHIKFTLVIAISYLTLSENSAFTLPGGQQIIKWKKERSWHFFVCVSWLAQNLASYHVSVNYRKTLRKSKPRQHWIFIVKCLFTYSVFALLLATLWGHLGCWYNCAYICNACVGY